MKELQIFHVNVNRFLPKINELRHITELCNAVLIAITESKLNNYKLSGTLL